ncbi:MAG: LPS export ABC transporter ATP-binding protein [Armatimonadetes bacterium]|nr:LPS export ABC transporter ATP-binding protein [Armatimonadota bacterium]MDE2205289.1 LPS export ABC transporter ATP-binding protein [Armatimonadota bacterium]
MAVDAAPRTEIQLCAESLVKRYGKRNVVDGISIEVSKGEVVGLLGPNGAGKTTTFYMIVGLVRPNGGHITMGGIDITRQPMYRRARAGIAYLPQEPSVFRNLTVEQNLLLVLEVRGMPLQKRREITASLLHELNIERLRNDLGRTLSGGERRRVEIARALAAEPKFILLDEPFTGVDPKAIEDIENIIRRLAHERGIGILITDHNVLAMLRITERAYIVADGRKRAEGPSEELMSNPEARSFYFGERMWQYAVPPNPDESEGDDAAPR